MVPKRLHLARSFLLFSISPPHLPLVVRPSSPSQRSMCCEAFYRRAMKPAARSRRALTPEAAAALTVDEAGEGTTVMEGTDSEGCVGARLAMVLFRAVQAVVLPAEAVQMVVVFLTMATAVVVMLALLVVHGTEVVVGAREVVDDSVLMVVLVVLVVVMLLLVVLVMLVMLVLVLVGAGLAVAATRPVTVYAAAQEARSMS